MGFWKWGRKQAPGSDRVESEEVTAPELDVRPDPDVAPDADWDFYMCVWGEAETMASIRIDLALGDLAPDAARPARVDVVVRLRSPNPHGLTTNEEAGELHALENALEVAAAAHGARVVAILTTDGRREWTIHGPEATALSAALRRACDAIGTHLVEVSPADDPEWAAFRNLWPNALAWGFIQDRRVLSQLESHGDDGRTARTITHYAYFADATSRDRFVSTLTDPVPTRIEAHADGEGERPFAAVFDTEIAPYGRIFALAESYRMAAAQCAGGYDGWESPVVRS